MPDTTITALPNATTPLDGTERVPMDKGGTTVDASTADIAATLPNATPSAAGKMSATDKAKVDDLDTAAYEPASAFATAAQGALADTSIQPGDSRLTDAREWTASEVSQSEAEAGSATTSRKWSALRVRQNVLAWWSGLLVSGQIPASLLPSYVDDVIEVANFAALPGTGETGKIYITLNDNKQHRWSGSAYITWESSPGTTDALAEGSTNLYFTTARALAAVTWGTLTGIPAWITSAAAFGQSLVGAASAAAARGLLELGNSATRAVGTGANTVAAGDDSRFHASVTLAASLSDLLSLSTQQLGAVDAGADRLWFWDDSESKATLLSLGTNLSISGTTLNTTGLLPTAFDHNTITYAATVNLDMAALTGLFRTISLTGNLELTSSNRATGRNLTLRLVADASSRTLTFPAAWVFVGTKPSSIAANKTGILSLSFFGTGDADCIAAYGVQA